MSTVIETLSCDTRWCPVSQWDTRLTVASPKVNFPSLPLSFPVSHDSEVVVVEEVNPVRDE